MGGVVWSIFGSKQTLNPLSGGVVAMAEGDVNTAFIREIER